MSNKSEVADRLSKVSDNYIKDMLHATETAFEHDESLSEDQKVRFQQFDQDGVYYGTDIYSDWSQWREMLQHEAVRRNLVI
ncbi:hypothetical protein [Celeribacter halophilus]|uniref:hypothetical protein n=1 Tax=Celeribacter halophilus TaxID=576117 RepID=UPI001C0A4BA8|nr:hypothetical protein [Celeribacter halophilus]MBU2889923.1 hypothetical protein [Celeribacter halophilus]MDO6509261.1 hypothetical protein [Celeribacter halophilus]